MTAKQTTRGIILSRTDYGEADRIITFLTPDKGKLSAIAKGVRRSNSRLAGGIELFSVSSISYIEGRQLNTLVSTRLISHYGSIVADITRTLAGYEMIRLLHRATEENTEPAYFELLQEAFEALNEAKVNLEIIGLWFRMRLLTLQGVAPNLATDAAGQKLAAEARYDFSAETMAFARHPAGPYGSDIIKFLRIGFGGQPPRRLQQIAGVGGLLPAAVPLVEAMFTRYIRL